MINVAMSMVNCVYIYWQHSLVWWRVQGVKREGGRICLSSNSQWCMKTFQSDKICQHCRGNACKHHEYKTHNTQYFATVIISACGKPLKSTKNPCHFNEFAEKFYYVHVYLLVGSVSYYQTLTADISFCYLQFFQSYVSRVLKKRPEIEKERNSTVLLTIYCYPIYWYGNYL